MRNMVRQQRQRDVEHKRELISLESLSRFSDIVYLYLNPIGDVSTCLGLMYLYLSYQTKAAAKGLAERF